MDKKRIPTKTCELCNHLKQKENLNCYCSRFDMQIPLDHLHDRHNCIGFNPKQKMTE